MKKIKNLLIILILIYILLQLLLNVNEVHNIIFFSYHIFIYNIIPNLFPFLMISTLLINYGFVDICFKYLNSIMNFLFKVDGNASFVFIMSLLTGFPSNSKYVKDLLLEKRITSDMATKILTFTHFSNPLFIIGTISSFINKRVAFIVLMAHFLGNIIVGLIFRNFNCSSNKTNIIRTNEKPFGVVLLSGVRNSIDTLLLIFGTMTFFLIISNTLSDLLNLNEFNKCIISGLLEFTQGLKLASLLNIGIKYKAILMGFFISFGGICVHAQVLSIISDTDIKYKYFLISRIIHGIVTSLIIYLII